MSVTMLGDWGMKVPWNKLEKGMTLAWAASGKEEMLLEGALHKAGDDDPISAEEEVFPG